MDTATESAYAHADGIKPPPIDLSHHYSKSLKNRGASSVKDFYKYFRIPNIANLAGGVSTPRNLTSSDLSDLTIIRSTEQQLFPF